MRYKLKLAFCTKHDIWFGDSANTSTTTNTVIRPLLLLAAEQEKNEGIVYAYVHIYAVGVVAQFLDGKNAGDHLFPSASQLRLPYPCTT